ncbi:MAG: hypothetical protein ACP6IP_00185 [Candidatus Njordarchaeia archaeon]
MKTNINRNLTEIANIIETKIEKVVEETINEINEKRITHEDDITTALGQTLKDNLNNMKIKQSPNTIYETEFIYIRTRGAKEIEFGNDTIWIIGIKAIKNSEIIYGNVKGARLQAKKCACKQGKLTTNKFGKWLKNNPDSPRKSCRKMNKKIEINYNQRTVKIGPSSYIIIYTNNIQCGIKIFSCNKIPNQITCEGLDISKSIDLSEFIKQIIKCQRGSRIEGISFNPFFKDIENIKEHLLNAGIKHIFALQITIKFHESQDLLKYLR